VPSGKGAGRPFKLRQWQRDLIYDVYGNLNDDGSRRTRRAILSIARKNGKTALIAALVLVHLIGPEAGINQDIVSAANDREQAGMVFKYVTQIIAQSPQLTDLLKIVDSKKRIVYHGRGNVFAALSAEAGTKHGMNPTVVIYDELAQSKNTDLFDALDTAQGAQEEPLFFTISTQSNDPQHPLSLMIDDGLNGGDDSIVCHLYEVPDEEEFPDMDIFDEEWWYSANPALGDFRSLDELRRYADRAKRLPSLENVLRNLYLNQRVTLDATLFPRSVWMAARGDVDFDRREEVVLGLDLAATTDLAALAMLSLEGKGLKVWFWKPEDLLSEHGKRDRRDYLDFYQRGLMEPCPGKTIDPDSIAGKIVELFEQYDIRGMAYDRWRWEIFAKSLERKGLVADKDETAQLRVYPWGQGFRDMSPAIDAIEADVLEQRIVHENHPLLNWNFANAIVVQDPAGNRKLDKAKSRMRIDGAVAAAMAAGLRALFREENRDSIYREEKILIA
jgi:phage terminase large subunit-like protein